MKRLAGKFFCKCMVVAFEAMAVIAGLLAIMCGAALWRLSSGPVSIDFAREYVEHALSFPESGIGVTVGKMVLQWPDPGYPVMIGLKDVRITSEGQTDVFSVDEVGLVMSLYSLASGTIKPQSILLKKPSLRIRRSEEGAFSLALPLPLSGGDGSLESIATDFKNWAAGSAGDHLPDFLSEFEFFEIRNASLMLEDHKLGMTWFLPEVNFSAERDENGANAAVSVKIPGGMKTAKVRASLIYRIETDVFNFSCETSDFDPNILARKFDRLSALGGHAFLVDASFKAWMDGQLNVSSIKADISSKGGTLNFPRLYDEPKSFDSFVLAAEYGAGNGALNVSHAEFSFEGVKIRASAGADLSKEQIEIPLTVYVETVPLETVKKSLPLIMEGTTAHKWLSGRLSNGRFHDVKLAAVLLLDRKESRPEMKKLHTGFRFENVDIDYQAPLMPARNSIGAGEFDYAENKLTITGEKADVGELKASNIKVDFTDVMTAGGGMVSIDLDIKGPLSTVLAYLSSEPIGYGGELGLDPKAVKGFSDLKLNLSFPTVKDLLKDQVKISAKGAFKEVLLPGIVSGLDLSGGPLSVNVGDESFELSGKGMLGGREIDFEWKEFFNPQGKPFSSQVKARLGADREMREHFGIELDEYLSGTLPVELIYTSQESGSSHIDLAADLTPAIVRFDPLEYLKPLGSPGQAGLRLTLSNGNPVEVNNLKINAKDLSLSEGRLQFGRVNGEIDVIKANIGNLQMGSNNFSLDYERETTGLIKMALNGLFLDAQPFLKGRDRQKKNRLKETTAEPPMIISAGVATMRTGEGRFIKNVKLYTAVNPGGEITQLEMDATSGNGTIYLRYKPDASTGRKEFRMEATDAGATLRAFGIYESVEGGKLIIRGDPTGYAIRSGDLAGVAQLTDFRVIDAPVLARLLSAMSLPGIGQLLGNEGVVFTRLEAQFDWLSRPQGALLVVREGRTSGNSLGLTFEGVVDRQTNQINLSGTIVPLSMLNSIVGVIPLVGELLAGGSGGAMFAATYTVKGDLRNPDVSVNPLAALAPGILRRILFEGG